MLHKEILKICREKLKYFNYAISTSDIYIKHVYDFLNKLNKNHKHLNSDDFKNYLLGYNYSSVSQQNQVINAMRFLYKHGLNKKYEKVSFQRPRKEQKLPNVIPENFLIQRINEILNIKHKTILSLAYSVGLRSGDILGLKISNIDSKAMKIKIEAGKGKKDAYLPLFPKVLDLLRDYYIKYKPKEYLFEGQFGGKYSATSLNKIVKKYIGEQYHFHNLRHSTATHLLNKGVDISFIQKMLRHNDIKTTMIYLKITTQDLSNLPSLI